MKTSTSGMQTAHPELHVAQQKVRAALQDAVARGRSKPEMEVCDFLATDPMRVYLGERRCRMDNEARPMHAASRLGLPSILARTASFSTTLALLSEIATCSLAPAIQASMRLQMWDRQALPCLHTLLTPLVLQHAFGAITWNCVSFASQMAHRIIVGLMA